MLINIFFYYNSACNYNDANRSASFKEDDGTWKGNDDGKVVNNQPQRVMDDRNGLGPQAGYIGRYLSTIRSIMLLIDVLQNKMQKHIGVKITHSL